MLFKFSKFFEYNASFLIIFDHNCSSLICSSLDNNCIVCTNSLGSNKIRSISSIRGDRSMFTVSVIGETANKLSKLCSFNFISMFGSITLFRCILSSLIVDGLNE